MGKDYVKYNGHNIKQMRKFIAGSGVTGKSCLVKVIYVISKTLPYHCKDMKNVDFFYLHLQEYLQ